MKKYLFSFFLLSLFVFQTVSCQDKDIQKQIEFFLKSPNDSEDQYRAASNLYKLYSNIQTTTEVSKATSSYQAQINKLSSVAQGFLYYGSDYLLTLAGRYSSPGGPTTDQLITAIKTFLPDTKQNGSLAVTVASTLADLVTPTLDINTQEWASAHLSKLQNEAGLIYKQNIASVISAVIQSYGTSLPTSVQNLFNNPEVATKYLQQHNDTPSAVSIHQPETLPQIKP